MNCQNSTMCRSMLAPSLPSFCFYLYCYCDRCRYYWYCWYGKGSGRTSYCMNSKRWNIGVVKHTDSYRLSDFVCVHSLAVQVPSFSLCEFFSCFCKLLQFQISSASAVDWWRTFFFCQHFEQVSENYVTHTFVYVQKPQSWGSFFGLETFLFLI